MFTKTNNKFKKCLAEIIFWLHAIIFSTWIILFFVPTNIWGDKIKFHLFYLTIMVLSELVTGLILMPYMHKYRIVCPLTTLMQQIRGISYKDSQNYDHSFVREFAERFNVKIPPGFVGLLIFVSLTVVLIQYMFTYWIIPN